MSRVILLQICMCLLSNLGSIYLAYVLVFVINTVCVVCVAIYVVNFVLLVASIYQGRALWSIDNASGYEVRRWDGD
jgi:uncharacterized membrane protein